MPTLPCGEPPSLHGRASGTPCVSDKPSGTRHDENTISRSGQRRRGPNRVNRGGSWNNTADNARAANRNRNNPGNRNNNLGFRLSSTILRTLRNARRQAVTAAGPEHRIRPTSRARAHTPFLSGRAEDQDTPETTSGVSPAAGDRSGAQPVGLPTERQRARRAPTAARRRAARIFLEFHPSFRPMSVLWFVLCRGR